MTPKEFEKRIGKAVAEMVNIYIHYTCNPDDTISTPEDMALVMVDRVHEILMN